MNLQKQNWVVYRIGWNDGSSGKRKSQDFGPLEESVYLAGYKKGYEARKRALESAMVTLQYQPFRMRSGAGRRRRSSRRQVPLPFTPAA